MPAGRPKQIDGACLINCTIPVKLRDFLKEHNVNRSELFRKAALQMYEHQICPRCYSDNIQETYKGKMCKDCDKWLTVKPCPDCDTPFGLDRHGTQYEDRIICYDCFNKHQHKLDDWFNKELSKGAKNDKE